MSTTWVTIQHPETGNTAEVALSALKWHEQAGWVLVTDDADTATAPVEIEIEVTDGED